MIHTRAQRDLRLTAHHRRGAAAVLAMMFLVIFGSLAAAMAIVAQGNLATADSQLKINRSLAAAETGMRFIEHRLALASEVVTTREGIISDTVATDLWSRVQDELLNHEDFGLKDELHNIEEPYTDGKIVHVGPIAVGPNAPAFTATLTPHPLAGEDYDSDYYQRPPYSEMETPVSSSNPLGARWIRVRVTAHDGPAGHRVTRSVSMDFEITKRIPYAILSKSRVMIGPNVLVDGPLGSAFMDTHLEHGHPIQMVSDFVGLNTGPDSLDEDLEALRGTLVTNDVNKDNRISVSSESETEGLSNPSSYDLNNDGYIDDYDFFLKHFDSDGNGQVTPLEMESNVDDELAGSQLLELIDTAGYGPGDPPPSWNGDPEDYPGRPGYGDGVIDDRDRYMKVRGEVYISADAQSWNEGAADPDGTGDGEYQDYFQGPLSPDYQEAPLTFEADQNDVYEFGPEDFDVSTFRDRATGGELKTQALTQIADEHDPEDPDSPQPLGPQVMEPVPFQAAHPYDYYERLVYENMTFRDVTIPAGENALFRNCTFIGVTFIETETENEDEDYNYAGMQESDGSQKHPDTTAFIPGEGEVDDTKPYSNNIRFHGCTFEGAVVSDSPKAYTHVRNKLSFTGRIRFNIDESSNLTSAEKDLYKRSTILVPHYSVELGTFVSPYNNDETVVLSGTIVAGVLDMRGNVRVNGTILTTFNPKSDEAPVEGPTSPLFNTTLGYFGADSGDMEAEIPESGRGIIELRYDPRLPVPDGILGPIQIEPNWRTYTEGGA